MKDYFARWILKTGETRYLTRKEFTTHLRTAEERHRQYTLMENNDNLYQHYSIVFGINCRSSWDEFKYFKVTSGTLIPDIMHDLLEGVLPLEIK